MHTLMKIEMVILLMLLALSPSLVTTMPVSAGPIKDIDIIPADDKAGATTDYEIAFSPKTGEATTVSIDFSGFGTTGTDMILSAVSTNIGDYLFTGFTVNPAGVVVDDSAKIISFTGGTTTKNTEHTIINSIPGTGLVITNDQYAETKKVSLSTASDSGDSWLAINPGTIDHYSISNVISPQTAGTPIAVTIQAQDQFDNDISDGTDASENITISSDKVDAGAAPVSTATNNGKVTVSITMTVAQTGQSITFTGDTSKKMGTSNAFTVLKPLTVTTSDASNIGVDSARLNGNLTDLGSAASVNASFEWGLSTDNYTAETAPQPMTSPGAFGANLTNLSPNTTYCFRAKAAGDSTGYGDQKSFTTLILAPPTVTTDNATSIGTTWATLNGNLTDLGSAASVNASFEWGLSTDNYTAETTPQPMTSPGALGANLTNLSPNTTYYFRAKAAGDGIEYGSENSFTTRRRGGGRRGGGYEIKINFFGKTKLYRIASDGELREAIEDTSANGVLAINIPQGTVVKDKEGNRLKGLEITAAEDPPAPPENAHIIGLACNFAPDGATFDPPMTLTWSYSTDALREGINEEELVLAYYDEDTADWIRLDSVVDLATHTITAGISHFTAFAVLGFKPIPAILAVSNLSISPSQANIGDIVIVIISAANTGELTGSFNLTFKVNNTVVDTKKITLPRGASQQVTFTTSKDTAGTYSVDVNGLTGSFIVEQVAPTPVQQPALAAPRGINWWLVGIIVVAVALIVLASYFLVGRR